jgi:hypothetical protein
MKRLLLAVCCALALCTFGPVPTASALGWPWHRHHKDSANSNSGHHEKAKKSRHHREKSQDPSAPQQSAAGVSPGPRTVGWWHPGPGPAGAGAE